MIPASSLRIGNDEYSWGAGQNYYDGEDWNEKNFKYLIKQNIDFNKISLQQIYINRDNFFLYIRVFFKPYILGF